MHEPADGGSATQLLTMKPKGDGEENYDQVVFKQGLKVEPGETLDVTGAEVEGLDIKIDESLIGPSVTETLNGNKALVTDAINNAEIKPASVDSTGEIKAGTLDVGTGNFAVDGTGAITGVARGRRRQVHGGGERTR